MTNIIKKGNSAFDIITDDWYDEDHISVDDHGQETVYQIYEVNNELIEDYPDLGEYRGYWGRSVTRHPYNGMVESDDEIVRVRPFEVTKISWEPV